MPAEIMGCPERIVISQPHAEVGFLGYQPPAGCQPGRHPPQHGHPARDVHKHRADVHEAERSLGEAVSADVMALYGEVRQRQLGQETSVQVGRGYLGARPAPLVCGAA